MLMRDQHLCNSSTIDYYYPDNGQVVMASGWESEGQGLNPGTFDPRLPKKPNSPHLSVPCMISFSRRTF